MKKLFSLLLILTGTCMAMEPMDHSNKPNPKPSDVDHWNVVNTTDIPVYLRWYGTKLSFLWEAPSGDKEAIEGFEVVEISPKAFTELNFPPDQKKRLGYSVRRELLVTQNKKLLPDTVKVDDNGIFDQKILVTNKHDLPDPRVNHQRTFYIVQPDGASQLRLLKESEFHTKYWTCKNLEKKPVYCRWVCSKSNYIPWSYSPPCELKGHGAFKLEENQFRQLFLPKLEEGTQGQLLLSFSPESLRDGNISTIALLKNVSVVPQDKLGSYATIVDKEGKPHLEVQTRPVTLINSTSQPLYGAFFELHEKEAVQITLGEPVEILPQRTVQINYPTASKPVRLVVVGASDLEKLRGKRIQLKDLEKFYIKDFSTTNWYNWYSDGTYQILPCIDKQKPDSFTIKSVGPGFFGHLFNRSFGMRPLGKDEIDKFEKKLREKRDTLVPAGEDKIKLVQQVNELEHEINYLEQRKELSRQAINALLKDEAHAEEALSPRDALPKIAFVFSGGGYRANIETIGFLRGAEREGILNCASYMMGLSGSTWAINSLVTSGLSVGQFAYSQRQKVGQCSYITDSIRPLMYEVYEHPEYREKRFIQQHFGQDTGIIGSYGHGLAWALLQGYEIDERETHDIRLSDLANQLPLRQYPLPISVAVDDPGKSPDGSDRVWYEFSPFYVGTMHQKKGSWIKPQYFGHHMIDGKAIHKTPEYPLAYLFGIFGSAFALNTEDAKKWNVASGIAAKAVEFGTNLIKGVYRNIIPGERDEPISERFSYAAIPNFNYGRTLDLSPALTTPTHITLIDGGITKQGEFRHNFASVPALWRDVDVIIMCDSVSKPNSDSESKHLMASAQEAAKLGYAFPKITREDQERIQGEVATLIAKDAGPIVVYMKAKKHGGNGGFDPDETVAKFTATRNFDYRPEEYDALVGLTDTIMSDERTIATIKEAIREAIKHRR